MKTFKTVFLLTVLMSMVASKSFSQATSLEIDNPSPGWLSSKIAYGDQLSVENLKVIGYLNIDDLLFIARLMKENSLHGRLDLEEANFVSTTGGKNNYLENNYSVWGVNSTTSLKPSLKLSYLSLPSSLEDGAKYAMGKLDVDTLYLNSKTGYAKALSATVRHLVIGENLTVITYPAFSDIHRPVIDGEVVYTESIDFPPSLREIREKFIPNVYEGIECKIKNGKNLKYFPNLERLWAEFQIDETPDSIFLPNIKVLSLYHHSGYNEKSMFKKGMHVFIGKNIEKIVNMYGARNIYLHFASPTPPSMNGYDYNTKQLQNLSDYYLYVPKGSADAYRAVFEDGGTKVSIIEEAIGVTELTLNNDLVKVNVGESFQLSATIKPDEASDKSVKWTSNDVNIVEVDSKGLITAKKAGSAIVRASSVSNPEIFSECEVTVIQPATNLTLSETSLTLVQGKGTKQLTAVVSPSDATDKSVVWTSDDNNVAEVSVNGLVTAKKKGIAHIIATSASNPEIKAICEVTVIQPVTGITISETTLAMVELGEMKQLTATVLPEDASNKTVKWSSSNTSVCSVTENGTVVAVGYGTATIVATSEDGGFPAACVVNVAQPVTVTAKSYTKTYGEKNPKFEYETEGGLLDGEPEITCEADETSPVGIYPIVIAKGSISNVSNTFVNGTLTITKAPLTVGVNDYTRAYGEENPEFELKYKGFVNNEDESVLLVKPQATTEADEESDAGEYDINIANGVAENYAFKYVGGKLTVEKAYQTLTWKQELGKVEQYEQIELLATASSGLDVTYTIEGAPVCSIVKIGKKQYLDCFGEGKAVVVAIQEGNQNYWQTPKIYKTIEIGNTTGIDRLIADGGDDVEIYDLNGNRVKGLRRGVNIVKTSDGKTRKVVVK